METNSVWAKGRLGKAGDEPAVVFGQVREDAAIELEVLRSCPPRSAAFCIGSGGCTAFSLLAAQPSKLYAVDINPAQTHLLALKKIAFEQLDRNKLLFCLLRDAGPSYIELRPNLDESSRNLWDKNQFLLSYGLINCGIVDRKLRRLMRLLPLVQNRRNVRALFRATTLDEQRSVYASRWNHLRWRLAFRLLLSKPVMRLAYGGEFVRSTPPDFAAQMKQRFDDAIHDFPLSQNGHLWQLFISAYPKDQAGWPPYLQDANYEVVRAGLAHTDIVNADAADWLETREENTIGFFALSNILEVTSPAYAARLMKAVIRVATPDAKLCLRSIFPFNDSIIAGLPQLHILPTDDLAPQDRSFFCTNLRVLRLRKS